MWSCRGAQTPGGAVGWAGTGSPGLPGDKWSRLRYLCLHPGEGTGLVQVAP